MKKFSIVGLILFVLLALLTCSDDSGDDQPTPTPAPAPAPTPTPTPPPERSTDTVYINDTDELINIFAYIDNYGGHYVLLDDIDVGNEPWTPIGDAKNPFTGTFDGDGYVISGIVIDDSDTDNQGFFGYISDTAIVTNLSVDVNITGNTNVGGIVGYNDGGEISNSYSTGSIEANTNASGIVGYNARGRIINTYSTVDVEAESNAGGIAGNNDGEISSTYSTGDVSADYYAGGIAGYSGGGSISNSAALNETITAANYVNRIVGNDTGTHTNNYAFNGTLVGASGSQTTITGSTAVTINGANVVEGLSAGQISNAAFWSETVGFDVIIWDLDFTASGRIYWLPWLANLGGQPTRMPDHLQYLEFVSSEDGLRDIATSAATDSTVLSKHYVLASDIALNENDPWTPIGGDISPFTGTFNGNGHTISGISVNDPDADFHGFFGYLGATAVVTNLSVSGVMNGNSLAGGIAGVNAGTISNSYSNVVIDTVANAGGIAGENDGTISNCYSTGFITATNSAGGIVGTNRGTINHSYSSATVNADDHAGGIVGWNSSTSTTHNCVALNEIITAVSESGRVIGHNNGTLYGNYAYSGMRVGPSGSQTTVSTSATATAINGASVSSGINSGQLSNPAFWSGTVGFDEGVWDLDFTSRDYMLPWLQNMDNQPEDMPGYF